MPGSGSCRRRFRHPTPMPYAKRFVRSLKEERLSRVIPFGECHLRRTLAEFVAHDHPRADHQRLGNELIDVCDRGRMVAAFTVASASVVSSTITTERHDGSRRRLRPLGPVPGHYAQPIAINTNSASWDWAATPALPARNYCGSAFGSSASSGRPGRRTPGRCRSYIAETRSPRRLRRG